MVRRNAAGPRAETKSFPRWLIAIGAIAASVIAYIGARGGPENAVQEIAEFAGRVRPPHIVSVQPRAADTRRFLVSIENPSLRSIQITGYEAHSMPEEASALLVTRAEEDKPARCGRGRTISLRRPLIIEPKSQEGLEIEPWLNECDFSVKVQGTSGTSDAGFWAPQDVRYLKRVLAEDPSSYREMLSYAQPDYLRYLNENGLPNPAHRGR